MPLHHSHTAHRQAVGCFTVGSREAAVLGGLAMKRRYKEAWR